ncbi:hypothetical protein IAR55_001080 [Kwoniella newhampshirensis]|uniref:Uncharacterized protein n=1 Tax=Kwoniella newhampshirensis TaxID=1651941 RepID=A0AAW0Z4P6_9TREE
MPRVPYEQHRAQKAAAARAMWDRRHRQGSVVESETDAESLFSNTTYQTQTSSSIHSPYPRYAYSPHTKPHPLLAPTQRQRTFSSTSYASSSARQRSASPSASVSIQDGRGGRSPRFEVDKNGLGTSSSLPRRMSGNGNGTTASSSSGPGSGLGLNLDGGAGKTTRSDHLAPPSADTARMERRERRRRERVEKSTLLGGQYGSPLRTTIRWMSRNGWGRWSLPLGLVSVMLVKLGLVMMTNMGEGEKPLGGRWGSRGSADVVWAGSIVWWVTSEGSKGGRSWRSQVTGIMTILLAPVSLLDNPHRFAALATLLSLILLSSAKDYLASTIMLISLLLDPKSWPYTTAIAIYLSGRCLWLGSPSRTFHLIGLTVITGLAQPLACYGPTILGLRYPMADKLLPLVWSGWISKTIRSFMSQLDRVGLRPGLADVTLALCGRTTGWSLERLLQHKIKFVTLALSILPPATILLYSSYSLRLSSTSAHPQRTNPSHAPMLNLLPLVLFLIAIPSFILWGNTQDVVLPLMPLTLLMALRGGAARGAEGGGTEDEVWKVGTWLMNIGVSSLVPISATKVHVGMASVVTLLWRSIIGASSYTSAPIIIRHICQVVCPQRFVLSYLAPAENGIVRVVFALSWLWGMKKLIEGAWAMGGLSGANGSVSKAKSKMSKMS